MNMSPFGMCRFLEHNMARTAGKNAADWPLRWDLLLRYRLIEVIALWEGRLTTNHLVRAFGIGRQDTVESADPEASQRRRCRSSL